MVIRCLYYAVESKPIWYSAFFAMFALAGVQLYLEPPRPLPRIVSLELARTPKNAKLIIDQWSKAGTKILSSAILGVKWDFVFIPSYVVVLGLGCIFTGKTLAGSLNQPWLEWCGLLFAGLALIAGLCDVFENIGLLKQFSAGPNEVLTPRIYWAAFTKFALIVLCLVFCIAGLLGAMIPTRNGPRRSLDRFAAFLRGR